MSKSILSLSLLILCSCSSPKSNKIAAESQALPPKPNNSNFPTNAYISANVEGGRFLILSDNTVWIINPSDVANTSSWLGPVYLDFSTSTDPNYPVKITNRSSKTSVLAKKGQIQDIH